MHTHAIFDSHDHATRAVNDLRSAGVRDDSISIVAHHGRKTTTTDADGNVTDEDHTNLVRGILGGGALGAGLGVAALAIPGVGPLAAAGAIAASAVPEAVGIGALAGAAFGSVNEVLKGHGVSDEAPLCRRSPAKHDARCRRLGRVRRRGQHVAEPR